MTNFTKGPWQQDKWGRITSEKEPVRFGSVTLAMQDTEETRANDRLASAAPELLEACVMMLCCMRLAGWEGDQATLKAIAAITKATGEQA